jgi:hypothetical protein
MMKIYALAFAVLTLWSVGASAQIYGVRSPNGYISARVGDTVLMGKGGRVIARGTKHGEFLDIRVTDGTLLRMNSRTGRIYHRGQVVGIASPSFRRLAE